MSRSTRSMNWSLIKTSASKIFPSLTSNAFLIMKAGMKLYVRLFIFFGKAFPFKFNYAKRCFFNNTPAHLGCSFSSVGKSYGYFLNLKAMLPCSEFHFYLESISYETDFTEVNRFKHFSFIAFKTGSGIFNIHPSYYINIDGCPTGEKHPVKRPVYHSAAFNITRAYSHIGPFISTRIPQADKIIRTMGEIGIHLKNVIVLFFNSPAETSYISGA